MLRAADETPGSPAPQPGSQKPNDVAKLQPETGEKPMWGEPVNGLRAAIVIRHTPGKPKESDMPDLYLAVQNVSDAPIRLSDTTEAPEHRYLKIRLDGKTQAAITDKAPSLTEVTLQPREVAFLIMLVSDQKNKDGRTGGSFIAEDTLKDARQTLVAELKIENAPAGAWTGKLVTGETSGAAAAGKPQPKDKAAQALFRMWQDHARSDGTIPGGLVGRLGGKAKEFIFFNSGDASGGPYAKKMATLLPRFDAARDRTPAEAAALLDDIAAVTAVPLDTTMEDMAALSFRTGAPLPPELANAPWCDSLPNGLRMAWTLEPRVDQHRLGTPLKSRILFYNSGKDAVVFRARTWHQSADHKAHDANGAEIRITSTSWMTRAPLATFRLWPGEYAEVAGAGIGVGANKDNEGWQGTRVGSWIEAKEGDEVTFAPGSVRRQRLGRAADRRQARLVAGFPRRSIESRIAASGGGRRSNAPAQSPDARTLRCPAECRGNRRIRRRRVTRGARFARQAPLATPRPHAVRRLVDIRPDGIPGPPRRPRSREQTPNCERAGPLHACQGPPARRPAAPRRSSHRERGKHPVLPLGLDPARRSRRGARNSAPRRRQHMDRGLDTRCERIVGAAKRKCPQLRLHEPQRRERNHLRTAGDPRKSAQLHPRRPPWHTRSARSARHVEIDAENAEKPGCKSKVFQQFRLAHGLESRSAERYRCRWLTGRHRSAERPEAAFVRYISRQTTFFQPDERTPGVRERSSS